MFLPLLLMLAAVPKAAPPPENTTSWTHKPTAEELKAIWPTVTPQQRAGGWADLECDLSREGRASNCKVRSEYPQGAGFGAIALKVVGQIHETPAVHGDRVQDSTEQALKFSVTAAGERAVDFAAAEPPAWLHKPSAEDLRAVWPVEALKRGESGSATLKCDANIYGRLVNCVTDVEEPAGKGFGAAAIALTPQFLLKPRTIEGTPVQSSVRIPLMFKTRGRPDATRTISIAPVAVAWPKAPSVDDVRAAYPEKAKAAGRGGNASVMCNIAKSGVLQDCEVITETPGGLGFDAAARKLARQFQAAEVNGHGERMAGARVTVPISFTPAMLSAETPVIGKPLWAKLPTSEDFNKAYAGLQTDADSLRATLSCIVQQGGAVDGCKVVSETPAGSGFGQRALQLAPAFRLSTWNDEGLPVVGARVNIPLRFDIKDAPAEKPAP